MWATAAITPGGYASDKTYFLINIFLIALLFIATALLVSKLNPKKWYLFPILPAVIASLYINWDMWAVLTSIAAIHWFDRKKYILSSFALAISIATKFFPVVLLIPIAIIFLKQRQIRSGVRYLFNTSAIWIIINLPFALTTPTGWWRFFKMNSKRPADLGSLWQALNVFNLNPAHINFYWIIIFLLSSLAVGRHLLTRTFTPSLAQIAFIFVALFTVVNKVYSPQYILWLAPLGVIGLLNEKDRFAFWIWQGSEALYHFAIWEYLGGLAGANFALPPKWYAAIILIRISATLFFALKLLFSTFSTEQHHPQEEEFLLSGVGS